MGAVLVWLGPSLAQGQSAAGGGNGVPRETGTASGLFDRVIANQKRMEVTLETYERVQKVESRKSGSDTKPPDSKTWRLFPSGPAVTKILLAANGTPTTAEAQRAELQKLVKYLEWVIEGGSGPKEAYAKAEKKGKERRELVSETKDAFVFTRMGDEMRGDRKLAMFSMEPNPHFKPPTRNAVVFTRVKGTLWIDEEAGELAKIEGTVTEDISIALFLAKVNKGSHFMQERYEMEPGKWFPSFEQYDFDGRKFLMTFSIHERTLYSDYRRVGPPAEALGVARGELDKVNGGKP